MSYQSFNLCNLRPSLKEALNLCSQRPLTKKPRPNLGPTFGLGFYLGPRFGLGFYLGPRFGLGFLQRPVKLIYYEEFDACSRAFNREMQFKNGKTRKETIEKLIDSFPKAKCQGFNSSFAALRTRWTILNKVKNLAPSKKSNKEDVVMKIKDFHNYSAH